MDPVSLSMFAFLPFLANDPAPSLRRSKARARRLECERVTAQTGKELRPGEIKTSAPRGDFIERSAVICQERLLRPGLRPARDEAILMELEAHTAGIASSVASLRPDLADRTWLVETYYPDAAVSSKIGFATKTALMRNGLAVSDRIPTLSAGDVDVLTRMGPDRAYPAACLRYDATESVREGDALLAVILRDTRETTLHAGICHDGQWTWLQ